MDAKMSNQVCSLTVQPPDVESTIAHNSIQRKKLDLPNELLNDITNFQLTISKQKKLHKISFVDAERQQNSRRPEQLDAAEDRARRSATLVAGLRAFRDAAATLVSSGGGRERADARLLTRYADGLRRLDRAKERHADDLERFAAEQDRAIASLRSDLDRAHDAYAAYRRQFCRSFDGDDDDGKEIEFQKPITAAPEDDDGGPSETVTRALRRLREACDRAAGMIVSRSPTAADGSRRAAVDAALADVRSLAELARDPAAVGGVAELARRLREEAARAAVGLRAWPDAATLRRAVREAREDNRALDAAAAALDRDVERLRVAVERAAAEREALGADRADAASESVALDEFCAVAGRMSAGQARILELGRTLAVDDDALAEERRNAERLKAEVARKQKKQEKLVQETERVKGQLEEQRRKREDLERTRTQLIGDLEAARSPPEHQCFGQRVKNLKQLKIHFNQKTNTRNALKLRLEKYQQTLSKPQSNKSD